MACNPTAAERKSEAAGLDSARPWRQPGDRIDSILPMPEYLRRFREGLREPESLQGGARTRVELARRFLAAVAAEDSAALRELLITPAEFAWLIFPLHIYSRPPYELDPALFWLQLGAESNKGLSKTLARYGSRNLRYLAMDCRADSTQLQPGPARLWSRCLVTFEDDSVKLTQRMFGSIVERDGRAKLLSFASGL